MDSQYINIHQDLIDACKAGDRGAQFKIYKLYYKAMYNTSLRIVQDTQEAEDIMQESFLDAFQRLDSYTGKGSFGSWLKRIVTNNSLDALRKRKDYTVSIEEHEMDVPDIKEESTEAEEELKLGEVKEAISQLPDEYRIVLTLFLVEGFSHEEISQMLGISNNVSRTRFVRAKQKILKYIREKKIRQTIMFN